MKAAFEALWQRLQTFGWLDILDIVILCVVFFVILLFLRRNNLAGLVKFAVIACAVAAAIALLHDMRGASATALLVVSCSAIVVMAIIFQNELRRGMLKLASPKKEADHFSGNHNCSDEELHKCVTEMVRACTTLAKNNVGALIILHNNNMPAHIIDSGTKLNSILSAPLLECIFNTKAPLHDGAVIVDGNRILAAGCFLPLSQSLNIPKDLGTRHRAGIGITEAVDVLAVIVSEENGVISVAKSGVLNRYFDSNMLSLTFEQFYGLKASEEQPPRRRRKRSE